MAFGNQARTSGGNIGCMIATPAAMTMVDAKRNVTSGMAPRAAPPSAVSNNPISKAGMRPTRAINSEPGTAAMANSIGGRLDSQPICVSDRCRSACSAGMTGGVASTVSRRHAPDSQSRSRGIRRGLMMNSCFLALWRRRHPWAEANLADRIGTGSAKTANQSSLEVAWPTGHNTDERRWGLEMKNRPFTAADCRLMPPSGRVHSCSEV